MAINRQTDASGFMQLCPTSPRHKTLPNGQIEIEGEGIPLAKPNNWADDKALLQVHEKFGPLISKACEKHGVPYSWGLAIATVEGGWKFPDRVNSANAGGVMAITAGAFYAVRKYNPTRAEMLDHETNIDVGIAFLGSLRKQYAELPACATAYNAGTPKCSPTTRCKSTIDGGWNFDGTTAINSWGLVEDCTGQSGTGVNVPYARRAVAINNSAIQQGLSASGGGVSIDGGGAVSTGTSLATGLAVFTVSFAIGFFITKELATSKMA